MLKMLKMPNTDILYLFFIIFFYIYLLLLLYFFTSGNRMDKLKENRWKWLDDTIESKKDDEYCYCIFNDSGGSIECLLSPQTLYLMSTQRPPCQILEPPLLNDECWYGILGLVIKFAGVVVVI